MIGSGKEIYQAKYQELYTPDSGQIYTSNSELGVGKRLRLATFVVSDDADVDFETLGGDSVADFPAKAGIPLPILVRKITAVSAGTVWLLHNGELEYSGRDTAPGTQATTITFASVDATDMEVDFTDGSGISRILVCRSGGAVNADPVDGTTYVGDEEFGDGDEIGTGNFVVGVGSGPFEITGLTTATTYHFRVFEFRGGPGKEIYNTDTATGNPASQITD